MAFAPPLALNRCFHDSWPMSVVPGSFRLGGSGWEVFAWEIAIETWPELSDWIVSARATLEALVDAGAPVAWMAPEGFFCDPPDLFAPDCMSGAVIASLVADGSFLCPIDAEGRLVGISDADLLVLRQSSPGLAYLPPDGDVEIPH